MSSGDPEEVDRLTEPFASKDEELEHWRRVAREFQRDLENLRIEHAEFVDQSRELEDELEKEAERAEKAAETAKRQLEVQKGELELWKERYHKERLESNAAMTKMQAEIESLRKERDMLRIRNRDLEQENDDLERHEREIATSLHDLESKLSAAMERTAIMDSELEASAEMAEEVQRLRDELRDQSHELAVLRNRKQSQQSNGGCETETMEASRDGVSPESDGFNPGRVPRNSATVSPGSCDDGYNGDPFSAPQSAAEQFLPSSPAPATSSFSSKAASAPESKSSISLAFPTSSKSIAAVTPTTGFGALNTPVREGGVIGGIANSVNPVRMIRDMLGRVKDLESRLASYRRTFASPMASPSVRRRSKVTLDTPGSFSSSSLAVPGSENGDGGDEGQLSGVNKATLTSKE